MVNCASPQYLQDYGVPEQLNDLEQQLINYAGAVEKSRRIYISRWNCDDG